jgi:heme/copper-type cytochrome/quinol oxidase subunit 1
MALDQVLMQMTLSAGGKVYLLGHYDQYNVIVTAQGLIMIFWGC